MSKLIKKYLLDIGMSDENISIDKEIKMFSSEMRKGLLKEPSSLKMIPTYITSNENIFLNEKSIVIDAGGTNLRISLIEFDSQGRATVKYLKKYPMIGLEKEVEYEQFFQILVDYLAPIIKESNKIGFCFSFPTEINEDKDGIVLGLNKGIRINGLKGKLLGEELQLELIRQGFGKNFDVTVINDTVACLLGGSTIDPMKQYDSFIGLILGTGTNTAYIEPAKNNMIINIESGGYEKFKQGICDLALDKKTDNFGDQKFEKMVSGAYLGELCYEVLLQTCVKQEFFSEKFSDNLSSLDSLSTEEISNFTEYPYSNYNKLGKLLLSFGTESDREAVFDIIDTLAKRCAKLIAINIFGIIEVLNKGNAKYLPICISTEGSTFFKFELLNKYIIQQVQELENKNGNGYCKFIEAKDSTLYGTAVAVLSN